MSCLTGNPPNPAGWRLKGAAAVLNGSDFSALGRTAVANKNYKALANDIYVGFQSLSAPRTVTLPSVDTFPLAQVLFIADESGQFFVNRTITITFAPGAGNTIANPPAI